MTIAFDFDNSFAALPEGFYLRQQPRKSAAPELLAFNRPLAEALGIRGDFAREDLAKVFSGNDLPDGADPLAQAYAGHQFGGFSPQLGDGRALLLGEVLSRDGLRYDIQLKGSGRTAFSRGGDGLAALGPVLREYIVSEAMFALGVPTTRSLAAVATGDTVMRETPLPGAVLTRVARSHLRVGHFEFFAGRRDPERMKMLMDHAIARHDPDAATPLDFLRGVISRQAELVAQWLSIGFIHGVMNTDNTTISGETIDYGPCAFMDAYHPQTVYSSIDRQGRYAYDNQRHVLPWNMAQLASALLMLEDDPEAMVQTYTEAVHAMPGLIDTATLHRFGRKIGLADAAEPDRALVDELLTLMQNEGADFTNTFRDLADDPDRVEARFADREGIRDWLGRWRQRIAAEDAPEALMPQVNPAVIPRNHQVEAALSAAQGGNLGPFRELVRVLSDPFDLSEADAAYAAPPRPGEEVEATFCGT